MDQLIFNMDNIKLLFVLASGLYSYACIHRYRNKNKKQQIIKSNEEYAQEMLKKINQENCDSQQIYEMLNRSVAALQHKNEDKIERKQPNQQNRYRKLKQQPSQPNNPHKPTIPSLQLINQDSILSQHLLQQISCLTPFNELQQTAQQHTYNLYNTHNEHNRYHHHANININQMPQFQLISIKSSKQKNINIRDAIICAEGPKCDQSFQFFPPYLGEMEIDVEDQRGIGDGIVKNKVRMINNQEIIRMVSQDHNTQFVCQQQPITVNKKAAKKIKTLRKRPKQYKPAYIPSQSPHLHHPSNIYQTPKSSRRRKPIPEQTTCTCRHGCSLKKQFDSASTKYKYPEMSSSTHMMDEQSERDKEKIDPNLFQSIPKQGLVRVIKTEIRYEYILGEQAKKQ